MTKEQPTESRGKQIFVGAAIMFAVSGLVVTMLMGWRFIPGWVGESIGTIAGVMSTPFFMEASFIVLGLLIVLALNIWRRHRDGDELVFLEEQDGGGKWAVYRERPLDGVEPDLTLRAEGALEIGDHDEVLSLLSEMGEEELKSERVMDVRIAMAERSGKPGIAERLRRESRG